MKQGNLTMRRIWLILWKNILLRRRHKLTTIMQFVLPIIFGLILVVLTTLYPEDPLQTNVVMIQNGSIGNDPLTKEQTLIASTVSVLFGDFQADFHVAYAPNNKITTQIMSDINNTLREMFPTIDIKRMKLIGFNTESSLELAFSKTLLPKTTWKIAIVFDKWLSFPKANYPKNHKISYKIRVPEITELPNPNGTLTVHRPRRLNLRPVARLQERESLRVVPNTTLSGITGLQILLDKLLIFELSNKSAENITINTLSFPISSGNSSGALLSNSLMFRAVPSQFMHFYYLFIRDIIVIGVIFLIPAVVSPIVAEKETGIKELMKMMGLPNWMHWLGWVVNSMVVLTLSMTSLVVMFCIPFHKNGPVLRYDDAFLLWALLILYSLASTAFCFFLSVFFHRPVLATAAGIMLWLVSYYALAIPMDIIYESVTFAEKIASALIPNLAFFWAIKVMALKTPRVGTNWTSFSDPVSESDKLSISYMFLMLIVDSIFYLFLAVYLESTLPSEFGVPKPWYYIFMPEKWKCLQKVHPTSEQLNVTSTDADPGFEEEQSDLVPGIVFQNLTKKFGKNKVAVNGLSFKMYTGQITAFLGHNGAGKTTTISILTGIFAPTSGTAIINGFDINTQMDKVRADLGLCPQFNMLFDELTVEDHLIFFGRLKGLTTKEAKVEIISLLEKLHLQDKRHAFSKSLSGGQKRKLSLMISLIGGSKVVILDEPTSGMDPEARRVIWDLLLALRGERTIILTTHFMEEADVLGDRIAIMASGKIKCCGTPIFLKKFYGTGYNLKLTVHPVTIKEPILELVRKHVENADWKTQSFGHSTDLSITLPNDNDAILHFSAMFAEISERKDEMGIVTIGLCLTSMDDVFSRVEQLSREEIESHIPKGVPKADERARRLSVPMQRTILDTWSLCLLQLSALILKRCLYTIKKKKLILSQIFVPTIVLIACIIIINDEFPEILDPSEPIHINLDFYGTPKTFYSSTNMTLGLGNNYAAAVRRGQAKVNNVFETLIKTIDNKPLIIYRQLNLIVAADFNDSQATALFSPIVDNAALLSVNLVSNAILKTFAPGKNYSIDVSIHILDNILNAAKPILKHIEQPRSFQSIYPLFGIFIPASLAVVAAIFIVFPVEERLCKVKQLQMMTGVGPLIYWGSAFLCDFALVAVLGAIMVPCFFIFQYYKFYTSYGGAGIFYFILLAFGFAAIPFSYVCTLTVRTVPGGFALVMILHILTGTVIPMTTQILLIFEETQIFSRILRHIFRVFPIFGTSHCLMSYVSTAVENSRCHLLPGNIRTIVCSQTALFPLQRACCGNCRNRGLEKCFIPENFLRWTHLIPNLKLFVPDIGQEAAVLIVMGFTYIILLLLIEYGIFRKLHGLVITSVKTAFEFYTNDDDVFTEIERVEKMVQSDTIDEDSLVVSDLCKGYNTFAAVSHLSFGVHFGECFGLLGVNGAGKTTTFRMLTGDETRSSGNAFILKYNLDKNWNKFLSSIGYCPQFDAILGVLSGRQMLALFGRLRGIPSNKISHEVDKWLEKFGLYDAGSVQCQNYSGGMKRRLSAAMAMIGGTEIILLDEPTSGVDPVARRQFWQVIAGVRDSGKSVILTSHSMDECEALCSRLGIMVNGQFQCLGGVQHLKNKFAQGYSLILKLKSHIHSSSQEAKSMIFRINQLFEPCILKDQHRNILHYQLLNTSMQWNVIFESIENLKKECEGVIEDFTVNETTLEDVFLSFAKKQHSHRTTKVSRCHKFLRCKC